MMSRLTNLIIILSILSLCDSSIVMKLERQPRTRTTRGGINFTLEGSIYSRRYVTKVIIGSPPQKLTLVIDTGSGTSWVSCGCPTCPKSDSHGVGHYSPSNSSSASIITCGDKRCPSHPDKCRQPNCEYNMSYEDLSSSTGFLVSDNIHFDTIMDEHFSTSVLFGCSNDRSGQAADDAIDGILGLNPTRLSLVSQLSLPVLSHCLVGGEKGGGVLILGGEIINPNVVYTPLDLSRNSYDVNLQSIAINGEIVDVDRSVFKSNDGRNPTVDSGARFVYLGDRAYDPVMSALTANVSRFAESRMSGNDRCFLMAERFEEIFPPVTFNFKGGASMTLNPKDYFYKENWKGVPVWCIGFFKKRGYDPSLTILGDLMLRDKIIVYDIPNKRIGWANQNCSKPFNVSMHASAASSPSRHEHYVYTITTYLPLFLFLCLFM